MTTTTEMFTILQIANFLDNNALGVVAKHNLKIKKPKPLKGAGLAAAEKKILSLYCAVFKMSISSTAKHLKIRESLVVQYMSEGIDQLREMETTYSRTLRNNIWFPRTPYCNGLDLFEIIGTMPEISTMKKYMLVAIPTLTHIKGIKHDDLVKRLNAIYMGEQS